MTRRKRERLLERLFDGESISRKDAERLSSEDFATDPLWKDLETLRTGAKEIARQEEISDSQFPAFVSGIYERVEPAPKTHRGRWALASLTAAALIVAVSAFLVVRGETPNATATVIENATTEIEGASVHWTSSEDGDATVWVDVADGEVW